MLNIAKLISSFIKNFIKIIFYRKNYMLMRINGNSMEPNFHESELYLVNKKIEHTTLRRFQVIILFCHIHSKYHIKRILGIPNDIIKLYKEHLFLNGKKIRKVSNPQKIKFIYELDNKCFFITSDNQLLFGKSCDSIKNGPINERDITGIII